MEQRAREERGIVHLLVGTQGGAALALGWCVLPFQGRAGLAMAVSSAASGPFLLAWGMVTEFERRYYQFVNHPAFNRDSGPVSGIGARLHWTC